MSKTIRHPLKGMLTLKREFRNIRKYQSLGIPTITPLYFCVRDTLKSRQAVLISRELSDYTSLERLLVQFRTGGFPKNFTRKIIAQALAKTIASMHECRICHNHLHTNHIVVKLVRSKIYDHPGQVRVRFLDLETSKSVWLKVNATVKNLDALNRRLCGIDDREKLRFLVNYLGNRYDPYRLKILVRLLQLRYAKKFNRKRKKYDSIYLLSLETAFRFSPRHLIYKLFPY